MERFETTEKIKTAVVTGAHPFDVPGFRDLWHSLTDLDVYLQNLDDFAADAGKVRDKYDVIVFYTMHRETPATPDQDGARPWYQHQHRRALESLGRTRQGIVLLHHALLAYPEWPQWSRLTGIEDRRLDGYHMEQRLSVQVAAGDHPITRGLDGWEMTDETYTMRDAEPGQGNTVLLTTEHQPSMRTLAWTREYGSARVFCFQPGHDRRAWEEESFRAALLRGVQWCAGRL